MGSWRPHGARVAYTRRPESGTWPAAVREPRSSVPVGRRGSGRNARPHRLLEATLVENLELFLFLPFRAPEATAVPGCLGRRRRRGRLLRAARDPVADALEV